MASENLLPFDPNKVPGLIKQGKIKVVSAPAAPHIEPIGPAASGNERAKQLFGEDFLGEEAIHVMEQKCQAAGIGVKFDIPQVGNLGTALLETAKADEAQGRARLVVLRPDSMVLNGVKMPITLVNLRGLFLEFEDQDNNPFGDGSVFYNLSWYENEDFAKQIMKPGYGLPTKEVLSDSLGQTWDEQQALLLPGERRREAVETAWDSILYYATTGKKLLEDTWDWTNSLTSDGYRVSVGGFDSDGLDVGYWNPSDSYEDVGVCPSR